jgi:hypothetical protein
MKRAHSAWITLEKVHDPSTVSCFRIMSRLTSMVTLRPRRRHGAPGAGRADRGRARVSAPEQSSARSTPWPRVSSQRGGRLVDRGIEHRSGAEPARARAFWRDVERNHARAIAAAS